MPGPTKEFWEQRFAEGNTPWDRGESSPQLGAWLRAGLLKPCRILVPGCGSGYEVVDFALAGFEVTGLDYADEAVTRTHRNLEKAGVDATLVQADVLAWEPDRAFDAVYEQTCLCALYPDEWREYADRLHRWLVPGGKLFALFMQWLREGAAEGNIQGPPYHCDINAMRALFPEPRWVWGKPPYPRTAHPAGLAELAVVLKRRSTESPLAARSRGSATHPESGRSTTVSTQSSRSIFGSAAPAWNRWGERKSSPTKGDGPTGKRARAAGALRSIARVKKWLRAAFFRGVRQHLRVT